MGTASVVYSNSAARRLEHARGWLRRVAERGPVLVVSATRGAADDLVRSLLAPGQGLFGVHRATPGRLAADLAVAALAERQLAPVTGLGMEALAARASERCGLEGLRYFGPVAEYPGFPRALRHTLTELRLASVETDQLVELGDAGLDLQLLATAYASEIERWGLADPSMLWQLAAEAVETAQHNLVGVPLLLLDLSPTSALEREAWRRLVERSPDALATVIGGDRQTLEGLSAAFCADPTELDETPSTAATQLARLRRGVFGETEPVAAATDDTLEIVAAPGEGREAVEVARRIHALAREGVPFDRIAILLRDPNAYLGLVEEALRRAGVPAWFTRGTVRPDPAGRAFLALLACAADDLSASRFAEYLSLGQSPRAEVVEARTIEMPWVEPAGAQLVFKSFVPDPVIAEEDDGGDGPVVAGTVRTPRRWEQLLVDAAVVGGRDRWQRRLAGVRAELEERCRALEDLDETRSDDLRRQIEGLANLESFALPIVDMLADLPGSAPWGDWLQSLRQLAAATLRRPERVLAVLAGLEPMESVGPVDLAEVRRVLDERLAFLRHEPTGRRYGKVFVAMIDEARGQSFDVVFLPGLAEGIFPRRANEDPLLLDEMRRLVDAPLMTQDERFENERMLLRIAVGAASRRLVVSYPTQDVLQGRARVPSFYALDIVRAAEGHLPDTRTLESRAASGSASLLGWPAPRDTQGAIDAAEFDVSYLEPILTRAEGEVTGRARFLLNANEHLARSLRARARRWRPGFFAADGLVQPGAAARLVLDRHRLSERSYSPTALQRYAACPYQFYLYAIQRLRPREEPVALEQMDPLTRGSLFHEVQYVLLQRLRDAGGLPIAAANRAAAMVAVDAVLDDLAASYAERLAPAIPRVWDDEVEGVRTDLRGWIREVAEADDGWEPTFFEFSFGLGNEAGRDPLSHRAEALTSDGYRLRGAIDLIEHQPARDTWRVTDHKTGRALRARYVTIGGGEVLQPLLYALAAEHHLEGEVETGRLFYCTRRGEFQDREVALNAENRMKVSQALGIIDAAINDGFLPAAPRERACDWCDFRAVCGPYEELRVRRKDPAPLASLRLLRGAG
ncbi:MAG TPA: PD-(D/E)XK nuclease family protein [Acidobacteriota bacterium]|nr:PD-(D/E)XK nuclease family protein [Acidobacteriota bacterium]